MMAHTPVMDQAALLDIANDAIILTDAHGTITYWNLGACRTYGWEKNEALGQNLHTLLRTELSGDARNLESSLKEQSHWEGELEQVRRNGERIIVASRWTSEGGNPVSPRLQINTDVTARRQETAALRESEEHYRLLVTKDFTGTLSIRADGRIMTCNPAFANIFGFASIEEATTGNFLELLRSRKDGVELLEMVQQHGIVERHELEMSQRDGDPVYVVARLVGSFTEGTLTDLQVYLFNDTKRKRLEQQLIQAQKMEGLGTLAGGIAHDFNNILAIILGYTNRVETLGSKPEASGAIKIIKEAVERGAALVQQLLTSARQTEARFSALDLNALVRELEKMLQATFPKMISFELRLQPDLPVITADRSQIRQVLLNLCVNARDAMKYGGTLTLETSMTRGAELIELFTGAAAQNYACIRVRDTGSGMSKQVKSHIFEPFFTTKERGKGTGLGLSVVYGVVNNHRGFVQVESERDAGATFIVYLPVEHAKEELRGGITGRIIRRQNAPQTILLVEDEEMLRDLGVIILESEGYRVLAAKDGVEAVALFEAYRDDIGLVVCDLGLPRLGGREAFLKMKESRPGVRAIVASGYLEPTIRSEMLKAGVLDTIQKPYDFNDLLAKIRSAIGPEEDDDHPKLF
jgi:two-component system, cell cycle sensor histidine kinase and response regulator CckA